MITQVDIKAKNVAGKLHLIIKDLMLISMNLK